MQIIGSLFIEVVEKREIILEKIEADRYDQKERIGIIAKQLVYSNKS